MNANQLFETELPVPDEFKILFNTEIFEQMGQGHRRMLYTELGRIFGDRNPSSLYKAWFANPAKILAMPAEKQTETFRAMKKALLNVSHVIIAEMTSSINRSNRYLEIYKSLSIL